MISDFGFFETRSWVLAQLIYFKFFTKSILVKLKSAFHISSNLKSKI